MRRSYEVGSMNSYMVTLVAIRWWDCENVWWICALRVQVRWNDVERINGVLRVKVR